MVTATLAASGSRAETDDRGAPCPCGGASARSRSLRNGIQLLRCDACGLFRRAAPPEEGRTLSYYRDDYWTMFEREQSSAARHNVYHHTLDRLEQYAPSRGRLVDVGCGLGALLAAGRERGWQPLGIEPAPRAVAEARARGLDAVESAWPASLPADSADAVTFVNVLDHVAAPLEALREAGRVLKPGGLLYIRVPNAPLHVWLMRMLPTVVSRRLAILHRFGFGRQAFRRLLPSLGFSIVLLRAAPPSQDDAYTDGGQQRALRRVAAFLHQAATLTGLDRMGLGLALEVVAAKDVRVQKEPS